MKKVLGICLLLIYTLVPNVYAKELPTISVGSFDVSIGDKISVPIQLENNEGFSYIGIKITYDESSLKYVEAELIGLEEADLKDIANDKDTVTMYAVCMNETKVIKTNGSIANITFQVKEEAKNSNLKIEVTDYGKEDLIDLEYIKQDGEIRVLRKQSVKEKEDLNQYIPPTNEQEIYWESQDPTVATIDKDGIITFQEEGKTTITGKDEKGNVIVSKEYNVVNEKKEQKEEKITQKDEELKTEKEVLLSPNSIVVIVLILVTIVSSILIIKKIRNIKRMHKN